MNRSFLLRTTRIVASALLLKCAAVLPVHAAFTTWDPFGLSFSGKTNASGYVNVDYSGSWEGNNWSTSQTGQAAPGAWVENTACVIGVNTGLGTPPFTITMNANHTVAGIFIGQQTPNSCTNTITGTGHVIIPSGAQGFYLIKSSDGAVGFLTISNVIAGTGQMALQGGNSGACQIFLYGNNTFSGGVSVGFSTTSWQGLLNYGHNNAFGTGGFTIVNNSGSALVPVGSSAYTIPNNFTISQNNTSMNFVGNSGGVTFSGTWSLGTNTFGFGVGGGTTFTNTLSGVISGSGGIFRQLSTTHGILALTGANTYTGKTTIDSSVTSVSSINSVANPAQSTTSNLGKPSSAATGTLGFGSTTFTGTLRYTGAGETTDRVIDLQGTTGGGTIDQSGTGLLKFTANPTGTGNGPKTLTLQGSTAGTGEMSGIIPDSVSGSTVTTASTASGGTTLTLASVANIATGAAVSGTGIPASTTVTAVNTSTKVITISAATTATVSSGATITVTGVKNFNTVAKAGTGTWTLSGANTHSGGTTFTAGTLNIANPSALGSGTISFNGGSFDNTTGSDLTLANSVSIPGSSTYVGSANNMTFNGTTTLTASKTLTVTANTVTLGGAVSGAFTLTKAGSGTLNLNHANGHTGTTLSAGNLNLGNVAALGTNTFTVSGGTLDNTSGADMAPTNALVSIGGTLTYAGSANNLTFLVGQLTGNRTISVTQNTLSFGSIIENGAARNLTKSGNGTLLLTGNSTNTGSTTVSAGTLKIGSAGTLGSGSYAAALSVTGTFDYNSTAAQTLSGVVSGAGSIVQDGSGELTFSGTASTFTGTITVNSGAVGVGAANGLPANSTLNLNGGTLDMGGNNATIKAIQIAGVTKGAGTYGALGSGAMHETALITSAGILTVTGGGVSTTTVISDNASVTSGNPVTFTVTVTGSGGDASIPDGSVTLYDGATPIGTVALTPTTGTSAQGTFPPTSSLTVGAHSMTGSWAGNTSYGASTSSVYTQSVVQLPVITAPAAPSIVTADAGTTNTLSITVQDPTAVTYQWKKGGVNVANGTFNNAATVSGSTTASLVLTRVLAADASPGDYTCVAHNAAGDATSFAFTLVVNDPVITVQPATSTFSCGTSNALTVTAYGTTNASGLLTYQWYTPDPAGTAITDATNSYLPFPNVHTGGSYSVVVSNAFGNSITSSVAMVTVVDTNAPMLVGVPASVTISCSDPVPSATVTATDTCDANPIVTLSAVTNAGSCPQNSFIVRTWTAHDAAGNTSTGTQTVTVVDTNAPVIALVGGAVTVECHHAYVEPGYSAVDGCAGTTVVNVTSTPALDTNTLGTYTLTYTSTDSCNNTATTNRVVTVIDATPPAMSLNGTNSLTVECHSAYTELGASATDLCAGTLPVNIIGTVDTNTVADYTLTYTAGDPTHNSNQVMRVVHVVDVTPPTFTVLGNSPTNVECHGVFVDPGATANDACSGPAAVTTNNPVNANTAGTYTITYSATDAHNNTGTATRVVHVVDTTPPTAVVNGTNDMTICRADSYVELGATGNDLCTGTLTLSTNGTVDTSVAGNYTIIYTATDSGYNSGSAIRTVHVIECAPIITSQPSPHTVNQGNNAIFSVSATCTGPMTYQWALNGIPVSDGAHISGATSSSLTVISAQPANAGPYTVTITGNAKSTNTDGVAVLTVIPATPVQITTQPGHLDKMPQGTNVNLIVAATGTAPIRYQWYRDNVLLSGQTNANLNNDAVEPPAPGVTNVHYSVVVDNPANSPVTSDAAPAGQVTIILDNATPTPPKVTSPKANKGTPVVSLVGTAKDSKGGNVAHVYYQYVNLNPGSDPNLVNGPTNVAVLGGTSLISRTFTGDVQPPLPGTNNLVVWSEDLAGHISSNTVVQFFYAVPEQFTLNKIGDGSGTVAWKGLLRDKGSVQFGTNTQSQQIPLNVGETYTLTYTPDKVTGLSKGALAGTNIVVSVLTNTAGLNPGTNSTIKKADASFLVQSNQTSLTLEFDRNRFYDMAGTYNAVFTASPNPSVASARSLVLSVVAKSGTASGYLLHADVAKTKDTFSKIQFKPDGSVTIPNVGGVTITGKLAWDSSDAPNAVKQFIGSATDGNWIAPVTADLGDKTLLPTAGFATMQIPAVSGGPEGTGFATVKLAAGSVSASYTLADDDKDPPTTWKLAGSRSGRVPQFVVTKAGDVLLGNLVVSDGLASIAGANLTWMHPAGSTNPKYPNMLTAGFTNSPFNAICSPFTPASVTGAFTLSINGGNVINNVNQVANFTAGPANSSLLTPSGNVTGGKIDASGKITVSFKDGASSTHKTTAVGVVLQNATNNGAGFFIFAPSTTTPTNSGTMTLTPQ